MRFQWLHRYTTCLQPIAKPCLLNRELGSYSAPFYNRRHISESGVPGRCWSCCQCVLGHPPILLAGRLPEGCHNEVVRVQLWSSKGKKTWLRLGQSIMRTFQHPSLKPELEDL